jgi:hypothetical protein
MSKWVGSEIGFVILVYVGDLQGGCPRHWEEMNPEGAHWIIVSVQSTTVREQSVPGI